MKFKSPPRSFPDSHRSFYIRSFCTCFFVVHLEHYALAKLTEDQYRRIQKHFFEGKSKVKIAKEEGVDESAVRRSLTRAYVTLRQLLEGTEISKSDFAVYAPTRYIKHRREAKILAQQYPCTTMYFLDEGGGQHE